MGWVDKCGVRLDMARWKIATAPKGFQRGAAATTAVATQGRYIGR